MFVSAVLTFPPPFPHPMNAQKEFDLPDQISGAEPVPGGFKSKKVEVFKKMSQVSNSMKFSLGIGDALGLFTLSPSFSYAHKTLTNTSRYLEEVRAHVSAYRLFTNNMSNL